MHDIHQLCSDPIALQTAIDNCEQLILEGTKRGITKDELNAALLYASALITLKADIHHAMSVNNGISVIFEKYMK